MHGSKASVVVDKVFHYWLYLVLASHSTPHPSDPTTCRALLLLSVFVPSTFRLKSWYVTNISSFENPLFNIFNWPMTLRIQFAFCTALNPAKIPFPQLQTFWPSSILLEFEFNTFEASKLLSALPTVRRMFTIKFHKHSMCFSCTFLINKMENQNFPQMLFV